MIYYYDSKGTRYKGKIFICPYCKKERLIRENKNPKTCFNCMYGKRKTDVKDNETFIIQKNGNRTVRVRAIKTKCSICKREYLRRAGDKFKTNICNKCICNFNGKKSYTTGIGDYVERALNHYGKICSICKSTENIEVHHIDFDRTNNALENLQVVCKSCHRKLHWKERKKDTAFMKTFIENRSGDKGPSKLTKEQVLKIRSLYPKFSHKELSKMFNCGKTTIGHIVNNRTWKHI